MTKALTRTAEESFVRLSPLLALEYPAYLLGIDADALNQKLTR